MDQALLAAVSGIDTTQTYLDTIGNNIANVGTDGFKSSTPNFADLYGASLQGASGGAVPGQGVLTNSLSQLFTEGTISQTGNPLDVAINGDGFLVIQTSQGERYTRNGALQINPQGELVTSEGYQVLGDGGPIAFQTQDTGITINPALVVQLERVVEEVISFTAASRASFDEKAGVGIPLEVIA